MTVGCGPTERSQLERALVGRGRLAYVADASWTPPHPTGTEFIAVASVPPLAAALAGSDAAALSAALTEAKLAGLLVDPESAGKQPGLLGELAHFGRVHGLQGAYFTRHVALYVLDPVRVWSPRLRDGLANVARRLLAGDDQPRMSSFPAAVRRLDTVEVMVLLRSGEQPRLWRSARGSSFARALLTATAVARQRWIERSSALGGTLNAMLPSLTVELALLQDDGEIGTRNEAFVDAVVLPDHGVGYERKGGWHYLLPEPTHKEGRRPSSAYRQLFRDDGLPVDSLDHSDLRLYRLAVQPIAVSEAPVDAQSPPEP